MSYPEFVPADDEIANPYQNRPGRPGAPWKSPQPVMPGTVSPVVDIPANVSGGGTVLPPWKP